MRKYDVLKLIFEKGQLNANEISAELKTAVPNIYNYLKELENELLIEKTESGKFEVKKNEEKTKILLNLQAITPKKFHLLITTAFRKILVNLSSGSREQTVFSKSEIKRIEHTAIPLRIILRTSEKPVIYCLKMNEALVQELLVYHEIKPKFTQKEFQETIQALEVKKIETADTQIESDSEVIKICEDAYTTNADLKVITKEYNLDKNITDLLKLAEQTNKEYLLFINALDAKTQKDIRNQWVQRYVYNTNSIEGNTMSEKDVSEFLNGKKIEHISKRELYETTNMRHAIYFLKRKQTEEINEELMHELHYEIQKDIADNPGEFKTFYNYVSSTPPSPTTPPKKVKERVKLLIDWYLENKGKLNPFILASIFHMQFELIHPFPDGNGRVGRLLMNHILERNNYLPLTFLEKTKQNYYRALANRSIPQFMEYVLTTFIEEYKR